MAQANSNYQQIGSMEISYKPTSVDPLSHLDDGLEGQARKAFIMKVYIILTIQFIITAAMCFISYYVRPFLQFQVQNQWMMWICFVFLILTQIGILCVPAGRRFPLNMILLLIFTLAESYCLSFVCAIVAYQNGSMVVVVAACMTLAIVVSLSIYAIFTKTDFTTKYGIVIVLLVALLMLGIFTLIFQSAWLQNIYCALGVIVFGIYLVIDTQMIIGGRRFGITLDDYVIGALILYIDIIQLFMYILQLLSKKK